MKNIIAVFCFLAGLFYGEAFAQIPANDESYKLYLTQIVAAEAFLQLNKISTANHYLNSTDEKYRGMEWRFLKSALDRSKKTITANEGDYFTCLKLSPDGKILAAANSDSSIILYEYPGMRMLKELKGHKSSVSTLAFSSDGTKLASGGRDHCLIVWDASTGNEILRNDKSFTQGIYQIRFTPNNTMLGVVSWERIADREPYIFGFAKFLDANTLEEQKRIELDNHPASGIVFTPDGKSVILASWGEIAYSYSLPDYELVWKYDLSDYSEYNAFHSIDIHPDGSTIALGSTDHRVHLINTADGRVLHRIEPWQGHTKTIKAISYSADGKSLATAGEDQTILVWNTSDYSRQYTLIGHVNTVSGLGWASSGNTIHSASMDGSIKEWDLSNPFEISYEICDFGPWQTAFTHDKKYFIAPCSDKKLNIYEASTGRMINSIGNQSGLCADISKAGEYAVTSSFDGIVRLWDMKTGKEAGMFKGHTARVDGICYMNKNGMILSAGDTTLRVWDKNREDKVIALGTGAFRIVLTPDENMACIGFNDGTVKLLETNAFTVINSFKCNSGIQEIAISPDGSTLAVFSGKNIELWDVKSASRTSILKGHERSGYGIGFSHDGKYLISGSNDQTFKLWNLENSTCTLTYHGYDETIYNCKILSHNEIFISTSQGRIIYYKF